MTTPVVNNATVRDYVGRLAPSPTGLLHLGHAATFLAAFDRARSVHGKVLLRIDDLDAQRCQESFVRAAREDLTWLGITWDGELRQSDRLARYRAALQRLYAHGLIYPCHCSRKDLEQATQAPHEEGDEPIYNGRCRPKRKDSLRPPVCFRTDPGGSTDDHHGGMEVEFTGNYRFHVPNGEAVSFVDGCSGLQHFIGGKDFGDFLVWRRDRLPSYQLASVVDDGDYAITEVVRGQDLLKSTARQVLLQRALDLPTPAYFHTPLYRDEGGHRLAKRHDALSLQALRAAGVTPSEIRTRVEGELHHKVS